MKPVLIVDKDGSLQVLKTIRGRKKSLKALIEYVQENIAAVSYTHLPERLHLRCRQGFCKYPLS